MTNKPLIVIPARFASTRFPGKPLTLLEGATGRKATLIQRCWEVASQSTLAARVVVATDDEGIKAVAEDFGAEVVMTSPDWRNGTERCAAVSSQFPQHDIIVNFQGDAPLTPISFIDTLIKSFDEGNHMVATPALRTEPFALYALQEDRRQGRVGGTTVVFDQNHRALYFSKEVIPYVSPDIVVGSAGCAKSPVFHHLGAYAYRREALQDYLKHPQSVQEVHEGLEQLRFLDAGVPVKCVLFEEGQKAWEVNNLNDVSIVEGLLAEYGIE